jgi:hypothetical protein
MSSTAIIEGDKLEAPHSATAMDHDIEVTELDDPFESSEGVLVGEVVEERDGEDDAPERSPEHCRSPDSPGSSRRGTAKRTHSSAFAESSSAAFSSTLTRRPRLLIHPL